MRFPRAQMIVGSSLASYLAGLAVLAAGCVSEAPSPSTMQGAGAGGNTGGASGGAAGKGGAAGSKTGGTSGTSAGGAAGGRSGGTGGTTTPSGGSGGGLDAALPQDTSSGGSAIDGPGEAAPPRPDTPSFGVVTNFTEFRPKFDPATVPGIQPLFNGKDLTGWNCPAAWSVKDGAITAGPNYWGFCATVGKYDKFRWFASIIQDGTEGDGGHTGMGVDGTPFYDLMTPGCVFWDYAANGGIKASNKCLDLGKADTVAKTSPDQVYWHKEWFQVEMLVDLTKGTIRAALNGVDFVDHVFRPKSGGNPAVLGVQSHMGGTVRYKDLWIEVNPKEPDKLLSATK